MPSHIDAVWLVLAALGAAAYLSTPTADVKSPPLYMDPCEIPGYKVDGPCTRLEKPDPVAVLLLLTWFFFFMCHCIAWCFLAGVAARGFAPPWAQLAFIVATEAAMALVIFGTAPDSDTARIACGTFLPCGSFLVAVSLCKRINALQACFALGLGVLSLLVAAAVIFVFAHLAYGKTA